MSREIRRRFIDRFVLLTATLALGLSAWTGPAAVAQQARSPVDEEGRVVQFRRDIAPILRDRCYECHNAQEAKNDYRVDEADEFLFMVEPGSAEDSSVYFEYLLSEDPDLLMPPPSHGGPLSATELALIGTWIREGAYWPDGYVITPVGAEDHLPPEPATAPTSLLGRLWAFQGFLHPATVHFPIALLLLGAAFVVLGWKWPQLGSQVPLACLLIGSVTAIAATAMGWSFAPQQGYGSWTKIDPDSEIFWHRWSGLIVAVLSTVFAVIALAAIRSDRPGLHKVWKIGLLVVAAMVGAVGHQGGEMTYGHDFYPKAFQILKGTTESEDSSSAGAQDSDGQPVNEPSPVTQSSSVGQSSSASAASRATQSGPTS